MPNGRLLLMLVLATALLSGAPGLAGEKKAAPKKKQDFFSQDNGVWAAAAGEAALTGLGMAFAEPQPWTAFPKGGSGVAIEGDIGSSSRGVELPGCANANLAGLAKALKEPPTPGGVAAKNEPTLKVFKLDETPKAVKPDDAASAYAPSCQ